MITREQFEEALEERQTKEVRKILKKGCVAVAGLGGLGSHIALMLARTGIKRLLLADFDQVEISNLNRQAYTIDQIGIPKTEAMKQLIDQINPWIELEFFQGKVTKENAADIFKNYSVICEAFDGAEAKAMLVNTVLEELPDSVIISGSGMAGIYSSNLIRTRKVMNRLYLCGDETYSVSDKESLTAARVSVCAGHEANMAVRVLLGETDV